MLSEKKTNSLDVVFLQALSLRISPVLLSPQNI